MLRWTQVGCVIFTAVVFHMFMTSEGYAVPGARYCQARPGARCCSGRDDACTMPIYDTVCYCDEFCNRTVHDCCPDFWGYCMGIRPPPGSLLPPKANGGIKYQHGPQNLLNNCLHNGKLHYPGDKIRENCNNCTCVKEMFYEKEYNWKCTQKVCVIRTDLMKQIGDGNYGWKASNYSFLWGMELNSAITYRLGTMHPEQSVMAMSPMRMKKDTYLPENFDSRHKWRGMIQDIRDQGNCASSWAFSTAGVASDRIAIQSHGGMRKELSPQHLISCNTYQQKACHGGHLDRAWWYIRKVGVVTDECFPYHSGYSMKKGHCYIRPYSKPHRIQCPAYQPVRSNTYKVSPPYRISTDVQDIMKEIMENGPVQATMEVREDFFMYRTGVYQYSPASQHLPPSQHQAGYHSVKIIGWGVDRSQGRPVDYWLCANSWGKQWGEDGYFRIIRGVNECDIESFVIGVWGKITHNMMRKPYRHRFYQ